MRVTASLRLVGFSKEWTPEGEKRTLHLSGDGVKLSILLPVSEKRRGETLLAKYPEWAISAMPKLRNPPTDRGASDV